MNTKAKGNIGEEIAAKYLENKRYKILERNAVYAGAEVDIIAYKDKTYIFCEVKSRSDARFGSPSEAVSGYKIARYVNAAKGYSVKKRLPDVSFRFDVIEVTDGVIGHIENAFDASDAKSFDYRR